MSSSRQAGRRGGGARGGGRASQREYRQLDGIVVVDKPAGPTSFGVVKALRHALRVKKAGHTGTLDPFATGVLPICVGNATKIAQLLLSDDKRYAATARLGVSTDTYDVTGEVQREADASDITRARIDAELDAFRGEIMQRPPAYSALRKDGKRAYELARAGESVELEPRPVTVTRLEVVSFSAGPRAELCFEVDCGKGTYIRSLAHDLGEALGCGAALSALRRLAAGSFGIEQAVALADIEADPEHVQLVTMDEALPHLPVIDVQSADAQRVANGQPLPVADDPSRAALLDGCLLRVRYEGALVALAERREGRIWAKRVLWRGPAQPEEPR